MNILDFSGDFLKGAKGVFQNIGEAIFGSGLDKKEQHALDEIIQRKMEVQAFRDLGRGVVADDRVLQEMAVSSLELQIGWKREDGMSRIDAIRNIIQEHEDSKKDALASAYIGKGTGITGFTVSAP